MPRQERRSAGQPTRRQERAIRLAGASGDLTSEAGRGTDQDDGYGGPLRRRDDPPSDNTYFGEGEAWDAGERPRTDGQRRPDEAIREDVLERLDRHDEIDATEIEVLVEAGEVTLQGTVADRDMRWQAEGMAESVAGVSLVHNRLRLARP